MTQWIVLAYTAFGYRLPIISRKFSGLSTIIFRLFTPSHISITSMGNSLSIYIDRFANLKEKQEKVA